MIKTTFTLFAALTCFAYSNAVAMTYHYDLQPIDQQAIQDFIVEHSQLISNHFDLPPISPDQFHWDTSSWCLVNNRLSLSSARVPELDAVGLPLAGAFLLAMLAFIKERVRGGS